MKEINSCELLKQQNFIDKSQSQKCALCAIKQTPMEINFTRNNFSYLLEYEKLVWKNFIKKSLTTFSAFFIVGILCLLDVIDRYSKTETLTGITFPIAIGVFLAGFFIITYRLFLRYKVITRTKQVIKSYKNENEKSTINIDIWNIKITSFEVTAEYKWSYFLSYKTYGNSVIIIPRHHSFQDLFFEKSEMPAEMYEQLMSILKTKFGPSRITAHNN